MPRLLPPAVDANAIELSSREIRLLSILGVIVGVPSERDSNQPSA
ncbi:hypothetical protein X749_27665 [Mesorhizobium sp. LNJC391B00]|nr:hypothetical protein X749_27665 [Mesorhizobium sp. LNJC391B00]